jgi:hypothetical protein
MKVVMLSLRSLVFLNTISHIVFLSSLCVCRHEYIDMIWTFVQQATRGLLLAAIAVRMSKDDRAQRTLTLLLKKIAEQVRVIALHIKPDPKSTHPSFSFQVIFALVFTVCLYIYIFIYLNIYLFIYLYIFIYLNISFLCRFFHSVTTSSFSIT